MAKSKKVKKSKADQFNFESAIEVRGPLKREHLNQARAASENKVLKSVRYDSELLAQIQKLAEKEGIPYQTLMNSLLKAGLEMRQASLIERIERIEKKVFAKHG